MTGERPVGAEAPEDPVVDSELGLLEAAGGGSRSGRGRSVGLSRGARGVAGAGGRGARNGIGRRKERGL